MEILCGRREIAPARRHEEVLRYLKPQTRASEGQITRVKLGDWAN